MYDQKEIEKKVSALWKKEDVPNKVRTRNPNGKKCYVLDGPPYTTGEPHVGHLRTTLAKDLWIKLRMMQGYNVRIQPGFDCNGLPIENKVERVIFTSSDKAVNPNNVMGTSKRMG